MMYSNKLVCSVKANGKFLREDHRENESTVYLPFKSEYSIFLKNLSERRALVHVDIDGKNMTEGGLIVAPGTAVDLERSASFNSGRKFRFIEKTAEISNFRGDNPEDGLIVVKWQFEIQPTIVCTTIGSAIGSSNSSINMCSYTSAGADSTSGQRWDNTQWVKPSWVKPSWTYSPTVTKPAGPQGITVEGSKSNQNFVHGYIGNLEGTLYSMVIKLYGGPRPIYVSEKIQCPTCGRKWKMSFEFCGNCGTALKK